MAVAEKDQLAKVKEDLSAQKKKASDLQKVVDDFGKERKVAQNVAEENEKLKGELAGWKSSALDLANQLSDCEGELARVSKALAKAEAKLDAARKIKEGLAELG